MRHRLLAAMLAAPLAALAAEPQTVVLDIQNMTCELCPITVRKALNKVPGVAAVKVDPGTRTATVNFDPDKANVATLVNATTNAGFPALARK